MKSNNINPNRCDKHEGEEDDCSIIFQNEHIQPILKVMCAYIYQE